MATEIEGQIATLQAVLAAQKRRYGRHGAWLVLVGVLWFAAFVIDVVLAQSRVSSWYQIAPFAVLTFIVFALRRAVRAGAGRGEAVRWHDRVAGGLWLLLACGMWATVAVGTAGGLPNTIVLPLLEWWTAIGMVATGLLFGAPWFWRAGLLWFAAGIASFFLSQFGRIVVYPGLILVAFIGPALWLTFAERRAHG